MAEFKSVLRLQKVSPEGKVLQEEEIDLRRGILGEGSPTSKTRGIAGISYYDISNIENGKITEWVCVSANEDENIWLEKNDKGSTGNSITIESVKESEEDGGTNVITFSDGTEIKIKNGSGGRAAYVKNVDESKEDGGINVITFSDGTKVSIKNGSKGSSISVEKVEESDEGGGNNVITFSDGTKVSIKNGTNGKTPEKGVDYYTPDEIQAVTDEIKEEIHIEDYVPKEGATMTGALVAQTNTNYTTRQVRNIVLVEDGGTIPETSNGDVVLFYSTT